jgi:hypothetical protein
VREAQREWRGKSVSICDHKVVSGGGRNNLKLKRLIIKDFRLLNDRQWIFGKRDIAAYHSVPCIFAANLWLNRAIE